jgi:hypothetical protein
MESEGEQETLPYHPRAFDKLARAGEGLPAGKEIPG